MKKRILAFFVSVVIMVTSTSAFLVFAGAATTAMDFEGGFEDQSWGMSDGMSYDATVAKNGSQSLKTTGDGASEKTISLSSLTQDDINNNDYYLTTQVKTTSDYNAILRFEMVFQGSWNKVYNANRTDSATELFVAGILGGPAETSWCTPTAINYGDWTRIGFKLGGISYTDTSNYDLKITIKSIGTQSGNAWMDDIQIVSISKNENIVTDGSFENHSWSLGTNASYDTGTVAEDGIASIKMNGNTSSDKNISLRSLTQNDIDNNDYYLTAWVKGDNYTGTMNMRMVFQGGNWNKVHDANRITSYYDELVMIGAYNYGPFTTGTLNGGTWTRVAFKLAGLTYDLTSQLDLKITVDSINYQSGTAWIDNVAITSQPKTAAGLVTDGSFEDRSWSLGTNASYDTNTIAENGITSIKMNGDTSSDKNISLRSLTQNDIDNNDYYLTAWVKGDNYTGTMNMRMVFQGGNWNKVYDANRITPYYDELVMTGAYNLGSFTTGTLNGSTWTRVSFKLAGLTYDLTSQFDLKITVDSINYQSGTAWIDNVAITSQPSQLIDFSSFNLSQSNVLTKVTPGTTVTAMKQALKPKAGVVTLAFKNSLGVTIDLEDKIGTGASMVETNNGVDTTYTVVIYGDVNGDGLIGASDLVKIKAHLLKINTITNVYSAAAGDVFKKGSISVQDLIAIKKDILGIHTISQ